MADVNGTTDKQALDCATQYTEERLCTERERARERERIKYEVRFMRGRQRRRRRRRRNWKVDDDLGWMEVMEASEES